MVVGGRGRVLAAVRGQGQVLPLHRWAMLAAQHEGIDGVHL